MILRGDVVHGDLPSVGAEGGIRDRGDGALDGLGLERGDARVEGLAALVLRASVGNLKTMRHWLNLKRVGLDEGVDGSLILSSCRELNRRDGALEELWGGAGTRAERRSEATVSMA